MPLPRRTLPSEPDDHELLVRLCTGDSVAFESVFLRYFGELVSFARSYVQSRDVAEDVVQDVFVRLWERRTTVQLRSGLAQYLYGAVRHKALDTLKHDRIAARWEAQESQALQRHAAANEGVSRVETDELAAIVLRVMATLPARCQEVFRLSRYKRLTQRDIAETLGITVNTVNVHLGRALRAIDIAVQEWERGKGKGRT